MSGQTPRETRYHNDWLTGNANLTTDVTSGLRTAYNHAPGMSRASQDEDEARIESWLVRGSHGQVKWIVGDDGVVSNYLGYGSWGNRIVTEGDWPPHIMPIYFDGDVQALPAFGQCKLAAGTAQDMTHQLGPLDNAGVSGAAGLGASAGGRLVTGLNASLSVTAARKHGQACLVRGAQCKP